MAGPSSASMPQFAQLGYNTEIRIEALDPASGAPIAGVVATKTEVWGDITVPPTSAPVSTIVAGPYMLVGGPGA